MHLTAHTDLGLRVLLLLGARSAPRLSTTEIAERYQLSPTHTQKVVQSLQAAGFVETFRGRGGGVQLASLPADIRVGDVVRALEPNLDFVECFRPGHSTCVLTGGCALTHTLLRAKAAMLAELDRSTLADIIGDSPKLSALVATNESA